MATTSVTAAGFRVREAGTHAIIVAVGGGIWAYFGAQGLNGQYDPWPLVVIILVTATLAAIGLLLRTRSGALAQDGHDAFGGRFGYYLLVVRLEYGAIIAVVIVCNLGRQQQWIMPIVAAIVGIHFFALANVLQRIPAYVKGALLCLAAVVTVSALPVNASLGGHTVILWALAPGAACALVLWADSVLASLRGIRALRSAA